MKSKKRTIGSLIVVIVLLLGFAGSLLVYRNKLSEKTKTNSNNNTAQYISSAPSGKSIKNFYDKPITDEKIALESIEANRNKLGYVDKNFTFIYDEKDVSKTAYHFDLYYKGLPVHSPVGIRGVSVITHLDNSANVLITGVSDSEKIIKVNTTPKITQDELKDIIKRQFSIEEDINSKLIVYETSEEYVLAYYIEYGFYIYIINAENGEIIKSSSILVSNSAEYEGQNGDIHQIFYNDYTDETKDTKNALWDNEKNIFIVNNRWEYELFGKKSSEGLFTTEDLKLGNNKSAIDGMANAYRAVEFFEKKFDYTFDSTYVSVNVDKDKDKKGNTKKDNAYGTYAKVNDDNIAYLFFLVSSDKDKAQWTAYLDLVAHEYTHAITGSKVFGTGYSEDSEYYEKNALMEAYSDIFGELVEKEYTGSTDWKNYNLRNISEPKIKKYTKRYITEDKQGTDDNDYGGAHQNSTIISHVAYLMSKDNCNSKYNNDILLDYDQLGQLWYGSLEHLKKTKFKDFADCRYAVEESARKLIEDGVLLEDNLKVIEQAFNEVGVSSNPTRRGAIDSAEIKKKYNVEVPIEEETNSTEMVEIEEIPTDFTSNYTAIDLIDKTIPEIIDMMNGEYQIIKTESDIYNYIQNQSVFPGMEFYIQVSGDDIISANNGEEIHSNKLEAKLESGELTLDGIQVNKSGKVSKTIQTDMDYKSCSKALGDFNCIGGTGGYLGGDVSSVSYDYNDNNAKVILNFNIPEEIYKDLSLGKISCVSSEQMKSYNPKLKNIVIRKSETNTGNNNS